MSIRLRRRNNLLALCLLIAGCAAPSKNDLPTASGPPFNQLEVSGNACGPAALLNSFRFGSTRWQTFLDRLPGDSDKARLQHVIRSEGRKPSAQLAGRARWSRAGINVVDLVDMGNAITPHHGAPLLDSDVLLPRPGESAGEVLRRNYTTLSRSLHRGFPPVVSVRRQVIRSTFGTPAAITIQNHFITITRVNQPEHGSMSFDYIDPWGGKRASGRLYVPSNGTQEPVADLPSTPVGKHLVARGEKTSVVFSAVVKSGW
jgi:hypothetical protein